MMMQEMPCADRRSVPHQAIQATWFAQSNMLRTGEGISGGLSEFSSDENGTVPFGNATVIVSPVLAHGGPKVEGTTPTPPPKNHLSATETNLVVSVRGAIRAVQAAGAVGRQEDVAVAVVHHHI